MTLSSILKDPSIFPDPDVFRPERWLDSPPEQIQLMEKYFIPFGRGSRMCVGMK